MRIPSDASPEVQEAFRQIIDELDRLAGSKNVDFRGRKIQNAGDPVFAKDLVTLGYLERLLDKKLSEPNNHRAAPGGGSGPVTPITPVAPPTASFTANPVSLPSTGGSTTLQWTTTNASEATLGTTTGSASPVSVNGSSVQSVTATTTFVFTAYGPGGSVTKYVTVQVSDNPVIPPGAGNTVKQVGTGFTNNGTPIDITGITAFTLFHDWAYYSQSYANAQISTMKAMGLLSPRIMCTLHWNTVGPILIGRQVNIDPLVQTDFYTKLRSFCAFMQENGMIPYYVVFGDAVEGFSTRAAREPICRNIAAILRDFPCIVEIINEPASTGLAYEGSNIAYDPYDEAQRLGYIYKTVDSVSPLCLAGAFEAHEMNRPPADWMGYQNARQLGINGWEWIIVQIQNSAVRANGQPRAVVNGEPICAQGNRDRNQNDEDPTHWWGFGVVTQLLKIGAIFHSTEALGSYVRSTAHAAQLQAFVEGRAKVSSRMDGNEFLIFRDGTILGNCPWRTTSAYCVYGRHNGAIGKAFAFDIPGGFNPNSGLNPGWFGVINETRGGGMLIDLGTIVSVG